MGDRHDKAYGSKVINLKDICEMRVAQFQAIYTELDRANIIEILKMTSFFSRFVTKKENHDMMEEVKKDKIMIALASLKTQESKDR
jgi:hypothetical protein